MMKWLVGVLVLCATASAQGIHIPEGFAKRAGGDAYKAIAPNAKVVVYAAGDVELTTISLQFRPIANSQVGIFHYDRELLAKTNTGKHVSDSREMDLDPILAESFDQLGSDRIYHRRLYAIDAKGVGHLWWTVCKGPATTIGPCEAAQRTMKLAVVNTAHAMPASPAPAPVPAGTLVHPPGEPWSFTLPPGFQEIPGAGEAQAAKLRARREIRTVTLTGYKSAIPQVVLVVINAVIDTDGEVSWTYLERLDDEAATGAHESGGSAHREHAGSYLAGDADGQTPKGLHSEQHTLYGYDAEKRVHMFAIQCFGLATELAACRSAMSSMRLDIPGVLAPESQDHTESFTAGEVVGALVVLLAFAAIPISLLVWILRRDRRDRRELARRRAIVDAPR